MTSEQSHQAGRFVSIIVCMVINAVLAFYIGKQFHSLPIGLIIYFMLGRLDHIADTLNELKRDRGLK